MIKEALKRYLTEQGVKDVDVVVDYKQEVDSGGYCDSCYYEEIYMEITYKHKSGEVLIYKHFGDMADLIRSLDRLSD